MSTDYFASSTGDATPSSRVAALRAACESWAGTPFRQGGRVKGPHGGVDCAWYIPSCFVESGALSGETLAGIKMPRYDVNHSEHNVTSLFHDWFSQPAVRERARRLDIAEPHLDGDLVFPKVGLCEHHIGFRIGNHVYHVARSSGPCRQSIIDLTLLSSRYRLLS